MNIFETAARKKFRFPSVKGDLNTEQLWDLPLIAKGRTGVAPLADLDSVARGINAELKSVTEDSFVAVKPDPRNADLAMKLDILKHIIAVKQDEATKAQASADRAEKRRKILEALAQQEDKALTTMSKEDLLKQLEALDAT